MLRDDYIAPHEEEPPITSPSPSPQWRVLIIDDNPSTLRLTQRILGIEGHSVNTASDGEEALSLWEQERPDVVLLDLNMPGGLDGRAVFSKAKEAGLPGAVVIFSAYGAQRAKEELGADAALPKPFDPETLTSTLKRFLPGS